MGTRAWGDQTLVAEQGQLVTGPTTTTGLTQNPMAGAGLT